MEKQILELEDMIVVIEKVPDQSGLKNVIQHTYYLKNKKEKESEEKSNPIPKD